MSEIELDLVTVSYPGRGRPVLDGVSLRVGPRERIALVGASGEGKTTLASLVLRLRDPDDGTVRCGRIDLRDVDPVDWRRRLAWVPQRPMIFAGTLEENVRLGVPGATAEAVVAAIASAALDPVVASLPHGVATLIGEGGRRLSAGESQRVALARAFLRDAPLLVLDEPAAHLDAENARAIAGAIERLASGRTTLILAHSSELVAGADRVVELAHGHLRERNAAGHPSVEAAI